MGKWIGKLKEKYGSFSGKPSGFILKKLWEIPEYRQQMIEMKREHWRNPEYKEKMLKILKGDDVRKKQSETLKSRWKDKNFRENTFRNSWKALGGKPTKLENKLLNFFLKFNLPYKYVGNGKFWIEGKCPDFVNINGEKICIEVSNRQEKQFHNKITPEEYEEKRTTHFSRYGWKCIVIWEEELSNEKQLIKKLVVGDV